MKNLKSTTIAKIPGQSRQEPEKGTCIIQYSDWNLIKCHISSEILEEYRSRKRNRALESGRGMAGDSPRKAAAKRRRPSPVKEEQRKLDNTLVLANVERGGENLERLGACEYYVVALAADVWCMKEWKDRREKCKDTGIARILLEQYRSEIEEYVLHTCRRRHP
jgi:hypothetical protein